MCVLVSLYHSVIISWSFDYLGRSFHHPLPWTECPRTTDRSFNVTREEREREGRQGPGRQGRQGARDREGGQGRAPGQPGPERLCPTGLSCLNTVSHQYFWYHITLNTSSHMEEGIKALVPNLTLDIFSVWLLLFIFMSAGLKFSLPVSPPKARTSPPPYLCTTRQPRDPCPHMPKSFPTTSLL